MMRQLLLVLLLAATLMGCKRAAVVQDVTDQPIVRYDAKVLALEDVGRAIMLGGTDQGWQMQKAGPGHMIGTLNVRGKHTAVVDVRYDTESYSVHYKDSTNLDFKPPNSIHNNYNRWVAYLVRSINSSLQRVE
ncbi:MAG: hypothetical protein KY410_03480 [Proteobacteria bacterium]|nr:hypothetical protein [Pseudomonadota bacterium]